MVLHVMANILQLWSQVIFNLRRERNTAAFNKQIEEMYFFNFRRIFQPLSLLHFIICQRKSLKRPRQIKTNAKNYALAVELCYLRCTV